MVLKSIYMFKIYIEDVNIHRNKSFHSKHQLNIALMVIFEIAIYKTLKMKKKTKIINEIKKKHTLSKFHCFIFLLIAIRKRVIS